MYKNRSMSVFGLGVAAATGSAGVDLGSVIAFGDEWVFSDAAFAANAAETETFTQNVVDYFTDSGVGNFLVLSNNAVAYRDSFVTVLESNGSTVTVNRTGLNLSAATLAGFDGVFLSGNLGSGAGNAGALESYVLSGGSVFVSAGTGNFGSPGGEANAWNPLLNRFGLAFGDTWFGSAAAGLTDPVSLLDSDSPLRDTLSELEWGFGQSVIDLEPDNDAIRIDLTGDFAGFNAPPPGGVLDIAGTFNVPIPAPGPAGVLAAGALAAVRRRR